MLVARIEIHPFGDERAAREIRTVRIANVDRLGDGQQCRYLATIADSGGILSGPAAFTHWRSEGAERCVELAIGSMRCHDRLAEGERIAREMRAVHRSDMGLDT